MSGLLEHGREEKQHCVSAERHQIIQWQNPDQTFPEEVFCTFFRGEHDHKPTDAEKYVYSEGTKI